MIESITKITAVLGPTNTGKTFLALERMLGYQSGVIGLPLRLLAREIFDKLITLRGQDSVALITGEERVIPQNPKYWVCTVEAMPADLGADFIAVDEIQLCADPERGYVFTERLLTSRGRRETMFMGSDTVLTKIQNLIPLDMTEMTEQSRYLTIDHIKNGAAGYAKFALEYPLKDRIVCERYCVYEGVK
mgnify:CR=1 FL=1